MASVLNNLAILYGDRSEYAKAEPLYLRSLKILEARLGPDDLDVAQNLNNLANLYVDRGEYSKAEPLYQPQPENQGSPVGRRQPQRGHEA